MKKLMVIATVALVAVASQAAQIKWSASKIAPSGDATVYSGIVVDVTGTSYKNVGEVVAALVADTFTGTTIYKTDSDDIAAGTGTAVGTYKIATGTATALAGDLNQEVNYYALVFDAATIAGAKNYISTSGSDAKYAKFSAQGLLTASNGDQSSNSWVAMATPEPTSGLLLLLGFAGLALRRRRA